jgi:hypothetical protein
LCGLSVKAFRARCTVSYSKVVEFHVPAVLGEPGRHPVTVGGRSRDRTCDHLLVREVLYR